MSSNASLFPWCTRSARSLSRMIPACGKVLPNQPSSILPCMLRSVWATTSSAAGSTSPTILSAPGFPQATSVSPLASTKPTLVTRCSRPCTRPAMPCMSKVSAPRSTARRSAKVSRRAYMKASRGCGKTWWGAAAVSGSIFTQACGEFLPSSCLAFPLPQANLGIAPSDDRDGCLQDAHWYSGYIGGRFQSYAIGNILSAQFYVAALKAHPNISHEIANGEFGTLHTWLRDNLYQHGSKFAPNDLVERATGAVMQMSPYLDYLREK